MKLIFKAINIKIVDREEMPLEPPRHFKFIIYHHPRKAGYQSMQLKVYKRLVKKL